MENNSNGDDSVYVVLYEQEYSSSDLIAVAPTEVLAKTMCDMYGEGANYYKMPIIRTIKQYAKIGAETWSSLSDLEPFIPEDCTPDQVPDILRRHGEALSEKFRIYEAKMMKQRQEANWFYAES